MKTRLSCFLALPIALASFVAVTAGEPDPTKIARFIKQFGSDAFKDREAATKRLKEMGEPALEALLRSETTLEQKRRADHIITAIEDKLFREGKLEPLDIAKLPVNAVKAFIVTKEGALSPLNPGRLHNLLNKSTPVLVGESTEIDTRHLELIRPGTVFLWMPGPRPPWEWDGDDGSYGFDPFNPVPKKSISKEPPERKGEPIEK